MYNHPAYGPSIPESGWVPSPGYLLRRNRILKLVAAMSPCKILEIGCGAGGLIHELSRMGFRCTALESSPQALQIARRLNAQNDAQIRDKPDPAWYHDFDCLMAFEVLEHIEQDREALLQWRNWLKPGGTLLLSVPAHMTQWSASDEWAGHYRRYEKPDLTSLVEECGFTIEHFEAYGSPLANCIDPIRARVHARELRKQRQDGGRDKAANSARSGVERPMEIRLYPYLCSIPGRIIMNSAFTAQAFLGKMGIGKSYLLRARLHADERGQ